MKSSKIVLSLLLPLFSELALSQTSPYLNVSVNGGIEFVITDPQGRRSGFDPILGKRFTEINRSYGVFSVDSEDPEIDAPEPSVEFMTKTPVSGEYRLTVYGTKLSRYTLYVDLSQDLDVGERFVMNGVIDSSHSQTYLLHFSSQVGQPLNVVRQLEETSLRDDLENCYELNLLGGKPLYEDLNHRVEKYEEYAGKGEKAKAREELDKLDKKLDEVVEKTRKDRSRDPNHFMTEDAYRILKGDVRQLLERDSKAPKKE